MMMMILLLGTLHTQYASAQYCESCYSWLVGWLVKRRELWPIAWLDRVHF